MIFAIHVLNRLVFIDLGEEKRNKRGSDTGSRAGINFYGYVKNNPVNRQTQRAFRKQPKLSGLLLHENIRISGRVSVPI